MFTDFIRFNHLQSVFICGEYSSFDFEFPNTLLLRRHFLNAVAFIADKMSAFRLSIETKYKQLKT